MVLSAFRVELGLTRRPALEATMGPEILLRAFTQRDLDPLVDPQAVGLFGLPRKVRQRRMNHQSITTAVGQALLGERHHQRLAQASELAGGEHLLFSGVDASGE